jgi:competence protein ComEA
MSPELRAAGLRLAARVRASRFAKPAGRVVLAAVGLACLAAIGHAAASAPVVTPPPTSTAAMVASSVPVGLASPAPPPAVAPATSAPVPAAASPPASRGAASADDPVVLNSASVDDLRRLPGIGEKRASAIIALRTRLGRLRAIEDLLKVKGIGRATLKRLRPLVRLEPKAGVGDAGA